MLNIHRRFLLGVRRVECAYAYFRLLSLDVALAALGGGVMAAKVTGGRPRPAFYFLLPAAVWVVYTLDHLLDGRRMGPSAATPRHRFHRDHASPIWIVLAGVAVSCAIFGWAELDRVGLIFAASLAALFAAHELLVKLAGNRASPLLVKELGVAAIFTAGTWGLLWLRHWQASGHPGGWPVTIAVQYFLLAGANLVVFSIFEATQDFQSRQSSVVQFLGTRRATGIVLTLLAFQVLLAVLQLHSRRPNVRCETILLTIAACHAAMIGCRTFFGTRERYRTLGDGAFMLPLLMAI